MGTLSVSYSEGTKVSYPHNQYDKADFHISLKFEQEFADPPDEDTESEQYQSWKEHRDSIYESILDDLQQNVQDRLEKVVNLFEEMNSGE